MSLLRLESVTKHFGGLTAVENVSLTLEAGEILGLMGANGAGKTTLFAMIAGNLAPSSGRILLDGQRIDGKGAAAVNRLGIARSFQIVRPFAGMSVLENVTAACLFGRRRLHSQAAARREAASILEDLGLGPVGERKAGTLTLAQRKRLEIARALGTAPRVLLLDEVLAGLTAREVEDALGLLAEIRAKQDLTLVVIEHVMRALMRLSDRIVVLHHGALLAEGSPESIAENPNVAEVYFGPPASHA